MKEEPSAMICAPVSSIDPLDVPSGAIVDQCARCGHDVWLAPSGQAIKEKGALLVCVPCGLPEAMASGGVLITKEQIQEIREHDPEVYRELKAMLRRSSSRNN